MNNRILGFIGLIGAPFLMIDTFNNGFDVYKHSSISGVFNLIYITGWMASIVALYRMGTFGNGRFAKLVYSLQIIFLSLANGWNLFETIQPGAGTLLYNVLDMCWPISNVFMLVTGVTIAIKGALNGWRRYIPLITGCWLPSGYIGWLICGSRTTGLLLFLNLYSAIAWTLLALLIIRHSQVEAQSLVTKYWRRSF